MITQAERAVLSGVFSDVRALWIFRARNEAGRIADAKAGMLVNGFEQIDVANDALLTDDGREVLRAHGRAWALRPEIHAQRLAEAIEQARQRDAALAGQQQPAQLAPPPTVCTSLIDGQLCGGSLTLTPVCPNCALGKSGVAATLTCDVCGHITAIMREN